LATRSGVRAPYRSGPVRSPYSGGNKMLTAMPGGVRLIPVAVRSASTATRTARPAKGRPATLSRDEYRYQAVPQPDRFEIEAAKRYRQRVAKRLARSVGWVEPPEGQHSRQGIAQDHQNRERQIFDQRARDVARQIGLTDGRIQRSNHVFGGR
jgi:hypothetical protein